jgi:hypothetical protein
LVTIVASCIVTLLVIFVSPCDLFWAT